jgi:isoleucyl-tRNA synthetase
VIGDEVELRERAVEGLDVLEGHTPHRPFIDAVKIKCDQCGGTMSRIPDVGNPWLDAGIVPFSTLRYRTDREYWEKWYPADWISESFPGQFRNWFYSLLAMATVIDHSPPFLENFSYASLYAEDGREMHKSWGNAIEFNEAADKMGVDVMRWLYCAHKPENNLLFGYHRAEETRRRFIIPLWNVYSFFTTYATIDGWTPEGEGFDPERPEGPTPESENPLDTWILARLNQAIAGITENLTNSDAFTATQTFETLLDDLSNWYVRRSRRRYWKSERDQDKDTAYATLWHALVKMSRALAPFTPFLTEKMYQNLVREVFPEARESVHHTLWPEVDSDVIDESLIEQMEIARQAASQGLSARSNEGIKVRQPLSKVLVHVKAGWADLDEDLVEIVTDELNIKEFVFVENPEDLVSYSVLPVNRLLGPKYGSDFPKIRAALAEKDPEQVASRVQAGEAVDLEVNGETISLAPEEILVQTDAAEGLSTVDGKLLTVAIDTEITPELRAEGLAREIVRRIQDQRKSADFNIEDRITTWYQADEDLEEVFQEWGDYIQEETLSTDLVAGEAPDGAYVESHQVEGMDVTIGVKQN